MIPSTGENETHVPQKKARRKVIQRVARPTERWSVKPVNEEKNRGSFTSLNIVNGQVRGSDSGLMDRQFGRANSPDDTSRGTQANSSLSNQQAAHTAQNPSVQPSRAHWLDDSLSVECYGCHKEFTFFRRRHHCRLCGRLFCGSCSGYSVPRSQMDGGMTLRVCGHCYEVSQKELVVNHRNGDLRPSPVVRRRKLFTNTSTILADEGKPSLPLTQAAAVFMPIKLVRPIIEEDSSETEEEPEIPSTEHDARRSSVSMPSPDAVAVDGGGNNVDDEGSSSEYESSIEGSDLDIATVRASGTATRLRTNEASSQAVLTAVRVHQFKVTLALLQAHEHSKGYSFRFARKWAAFIVCTAMFLAPRIKSTSPRASFDMITVAGGSISDCAIMEGQIHKGFPSLDATVKSGPLRVLLVKQDIVFDRHSDRLCSTNDAIMQELDYLDLNTQKIQSLRPNVVVCANRVSFHVVKLLAQQNVATLPFVSTEQFSRLATESGATVLPGIENIREGVNYCGTISELKMLTYLAGKEHRIMKCKRRAQTWTDCISDSGDSDSDNDSTVHPVASEFKTTHSAGGLKRAHNELQPHQKRLLYTFLGLRDTYTVVLRGASQKSLKLVKHILSQVLTSAHACICEGSLVTDSLLMPKDSVVTEAVRSIPSMYVPYSCLFKFNALEYPVKYVTLSNNNDNEQVKVRLSDEPSRFMTLVPILDVINTQSLQEWHAKIVNEADSELLLFSDQPPMAYFLLLSHLNNILARTVVGIAMLSLHVSGKYTFPVQTLRSLLIFDQKEDISSIRNKLGILLQPHYSLIEQAWLFDLNTGLQLTPFVSAKAHERSPFAFENWTCLVWDRVAAAISVQSYVSSSALIKSMEQSGDLDRFLTYARGTCKEHAMHPFAWTAKQTLPTTMEYVKAQFIASQLDWSDVDAVLNASAHTPKPIVPLHYLSTHYSSASDQTLILPLASREGSDIEDNPAILNIDARMLSDDVVLESFFREHMNKVFDVPNDTFSLAYSRMLYAYMQAMRSVSSLQLIGMGLHHLPLLTKGQTRFAFGFTSNAPDPYYMYKQRSTAIPSTSAYLLAEVLTKQHPLVRSTSNSAALAVPIYTLSHPRPLADLTFSSMSLNTMTNPVIAFPYIPSDLLNHDDLMKPVQKGAVAPSESDVVLGLSMLDSYNTPAHESSFFTSFLRKKLAKVERDSLLFILPSVPEKQQPQAPPFTFQRTEGRYSVYFSAEDGEQCAQPETMMHTQYSDDDMTLQRFLDLHYLDRLRCASPKCGRSVFKHFAGFLSLDGRSTLRAKHLHAAQVPSVFMEERYLSSVVPLLSFQMMMKQAFVDATTLQPSSEAVQPVDGSLQSCFSSKTVRVAHKSSAAARSWLGTIDKELALRNQQFADTVHGEADAREAFSVPALVWSRCMLCGAESSCRFLSTKTTQLSMAHFLSLLQSHSLIFREIVCEHVASSPRNMLRIMVFGSVMLCFQNEAVRPLRLRAITKTGPMPPLKVEVSRMRTLQNIHEAMQLGVLTVGSQCLQIVLRYCNSSEKQVLESFKVRMTLRHSLMTKQHIILQALLTHSTASDDQFNQKENVLRAQLLALEYYIQHAFLCWNRFIYEMYATLILRHSNAYVAVRDGDAIPSSPSFPRINAQSLSHQSSGETTFPSRHSSMTVIDEDPISPELEPISEDASTNDTSPSNANLHDDEEVHVLESGSIACDMTLETIASTTKILLSNFVLVDLVDIEESLERSASGVETNTVRRVIAGQIGNKATILGREALHAINMRVQSGDVSPDLYKLCSFSHVWLQSVPTLFLVGRQASFDTALASTMIASSLKSVKHQRFLALASAPFVVKRPPGPSVCVRRLFPALTSTVSCLCDSAETQCNAACKSCEFQSEATTFDNANLSTEASHIILSNKVSSYISSNGGKPSAYINSIRDEQEGDAKDSQFVRSYLELPSSTDVQSCGEVYKLLKNIYKEDDSGESSPDEVSSRVGNAIVMVHHPVQFEALRSLIWTRNVSFNNCLMDMDAWNIGGGKSGCSFSKSSNDTLVIKSVSTTELDMILRISQTYFQYKSSNLQNNIPSLLVPVFGAYTINLKGQERHYIVMPNMNLNINPQRRFDLKGSQRNRYVREDLSQNSTLVGMDTNFQEWSRRTPVALDASSHSYLRAAIHNDSTFLCSCNIVDYSLLVSFTDDTLTCGIIDYFRYYSWDKRLETGVKSVGQLAGRKQPTVIPPSHYRSRFRLAMDRYFTGVPDKVSVPDLSLTTLTYNPFYAVFDPYYTEKLKAANLLYQAHIRKEAGLDTVLPQVYPCSTILKTLLARYACLLVNSVSSVRIFIMRPQQLLVSATCPQVEPLHLPVLPEVEIPQVTINKTQASLPDKDDPAKANEAKSPEFLITDRSSSQLQLKQQQITSPTEKAKAEDDVATEVSINRNNQILAHQPEKPKSTSWFSKLQNRK